MKDLGKLKYFLGIEVGRGDEGFMITQRKYTLDLIAEVGSLGAKPCATPMEQQHKLGRDNSPFIVNAGKYRRLVGKLIYLSITRSGISYYVHILAQFMQTPREAQWEAALRGCVPLKELQVKVYFSVQILIYDSQYTATQTGHHVPPSDDH